MVKEDRREKQAEKLWGAFVFLFLSVTGLLNQCVYKKRIRMFLIHKPVVKRAARLVLFQAFLKLCHLCIMHQWYEFRQRPQLSPKRETPELHAELQACRQRQLTFLFQSAAISKIAASGKSPSRVVMRPREEMASAHTTYDRRPFKVLFHLIIFELHFHVEVMREETMQKKEKKTGHKSG